MVYLHLQFQRDEFHHSGEGTVAGAGNQVVTFSFTGQKQRGRTGSEWGINLKAHPHWHAFSGKALPPKGFITSPKQYHQLGTKLSNIRTYGHHFSFKPPQPVTTLSSTGVFSAIWRQRNCLRNVLLNVQVRKVFWNVVREHVSSGLLFWREIKFHHI